MKYIFSQLAHLTPQLKLQKGFTLIEFMLVSAIVVVLLGLGTISLLTVSHKSQLSGTVDSFLADIKEQQIKAMVGDAENGSGASNYGIRFGSTLYTLYRGTFGTSNFAVALPNTIQVTTTFPSSDLIFTKGSGEISGFTSSASATVTLKDITDGTQKKVTFNKLGTIILIN